jgi:hypothetical protein
MEKKNCIRFYFVSFFLIACEFAAFAQPGDDDGGGGLEEGSDPQPASIDSTLIVLLVMGILFAFYTYLKHKRAIK